MLRIPDLKQMQVNTKIHEALVARIAGTTGSPPSSCEALRVGLLVSPDQLHPAGVPVRCTETAMLRER